ncbi:MAG: threonine synthase [Candidatus Hermodarchaeota archaeon]
MLKFHSTNYNTPDVDFRTAVLQGQALDKGLYMLNKIPNLDPQEIYNFRNLNLQEIAFQVLYKIIKQQIPKEDLKKIITKALNFEIELENIELNDYLCYLSKGPTCSFKDFGARLLARVMEYFLLLEDKEIIILTATSGDTGGAVAQAMYSMSRIKVIVLYPKEEISDLQRKQMTTLGKNVIAIGINGKFDDCQRIIKTAFADKELKDFNLSSANSINIGRLLPQVIYYFWSYSRIAKEPGEKVIYSVPSGNFGNLTGGIIAYKMGLPVEIFISAVNENDEFPKFLSSGIYEPIIPSINCLSSAMNVGNPSNLARIFDLFKGHIDQNGYIHKKPNMKKLRSIIDSFSISNELTKDTIVEFYSKFGKIIEPHGAVGWAALQLYRKMNPNHNGFKSITYETADPAKFPEEIISLIKLKPKLPKPLETIQNKEEYPNPVEINEYKDFKIFVQNNI